MLDEENITEISREREFKDLNPNEKLEVKSDKNVIWEENNFKNESNPAQQEKVPKIKEIPKEQDEDDIANPIQQANNEINKTENNLNKISYINFNCDVIYEID